VTETSGSLVKVEKGLRRGTWVIAVYLAAGVGLGFARFYVELVLRPPFPIWWVYAYLVAAIALTAAVLWYLAYRSNPRILGFVRSLSGELREADYVPWGMKRRGLLLAFRNGVFLNVQRNVFSFRLFLADGSVLRPTLDELPAFLRSYRGAKRRGLVSARKGDTWMEAEVERLRVLLKSRWVVVLLYEKPESDVPIPSTGKWTVVGLFYTPKWSQRGDAVRDACDDIEKLLEQSRTNVSA
jgi:hypothetical protein